MNLWTVKERKWTLEFDSIPVLKKNICIIKICPIKSFIILTPIEANRLFYCRQTVNSNIIIESLDTFGRKWALKSE